MELRRLALVLLGGIAVVASACSTGPPLTDSPTTRPTPGNPAFATGGTVTVAVPYLPRIFNPSTPAGANRVTQMAMEQVWPQAFVLDPEFQPETTGFVDDAEVIGLDPMTVDYQIDPKATWSDGHPITASDFAYNWRQQLRVDPLLPSTGVVAGYRDIRTIFGSDHGKTVTVVFAKPYADWEGLFANLIPAHIAQRGGWVAAFAGFNPSELISGGPFKVSAFVPGARLVLTRNGKYWGTPAHLRTIVFRVEHSDRASLLGLQNRSVSIVEVSAGPQVDHAIARGAQLGESLSSTTTSSPVLWQLVFNLNDPVLANPDMRRALALVTDRDALAADSVNLADPLNSGAESRVFSEGQPGATSEVLPTLKYSPIAAARLFRSLGYVSDARGYLRTFGLSTPLSLTVTGPTGNALVDALELELQADWAAAGIELTIRNVSTSDLLDRVLPRGAYQLALAPFVIPAFPSWNAIVYTNSVLPSSASSPDLNSRLARSSVSPGATDVDGAHPGSTTAGSASWLWSVPTRVGTEPGAASEGVVTRDVTGLNDPRVGALFAMAMSELNANSQALTLSKLDTLLSRDLPTLPLFQAPVSLVERSDIVNVSESPSWAGPLWDAEDWAIELPPSAG